MPPAPGNGPAPHRLVRMVTCIRGALTFDVTVAPRFDYGRRKHDVRLTEVGAVFQAGDDGLTLHAVRERDDERLAHVSNEDGDLHAQLPLSAGQTRGDRTRVGRADAAGDQPDGDRAGACGDGRLLAVLGRRVDLSRPLA